MHTGLQRKKLGRLKNLIPKDLLRKNDPNIPDLPEPVIVRHFTKLSRMNYAIDIGPYPLGSCTMKYNPKYMERLANNKNISLLHDILPEENCQGILELLYKLEEYLCEITGMNKFLFNLLQGLTESLQEF